jgi:hypothetical protein
MKIATAADPRSLALAVKRYYKSNPFMASIEFLGTYHLFSGDNCVNAALEARTEYPTGQNLQQYEYLTPAVASALRHGDVAGAIQNLGKVADRPVRLIQ